MMENTTKIAVLSDIHSNLTALEAVIADLRQERVNEVWLLGDLLMFGHGADDLLALLAELPVTVSIRGNWDDLFLGIYDKRLPIDDQGDVYITKLGKFLSENISPENVEYVRNLPLTATREVKGLKFSFSHNLPERNWGRALLPFVPQENFDQLFVHESSDVALYGHVHHQMMRYSSKEQLIINPGSVGQPYQNWRECKLDLRAPAEPEAKTSTVCTTHCSLAMSAPSRRLARISVHS